MLLVPTKVLIAIAAVVWMAAGASVTYVGVTAMDGGWTLAVLIAFLVVFAFFIILFMRITNKHIKRICSYTEEAKGLYTFFDPQTYIIIAVMIFLGAAVRISTFVPDPAIAAIYTAIGLALMICAVYYTVTFVAIYEGLNYKTAKSVGRKQN